MSLFELAFNNCKSNIKSYLMLFISMVFSVIVLCNMQILCHGETMNALRAMNPYIMDAIFQVMIVLLTVFILFFTWYASNTFLRKRKKEIGIYLFMGVDIRTISRLYLLENLFLGIFACVLGEAIGALFSKFFQVMVIGLAGFDLDLVYDVRPEALIQTFIIFMVIFLLISIKGMISIQRSQVIELLTANKQEEKTPKIGLIYYVEAIVAILILSYGYYLSTLAGTNARYILPTVISVLVGTYGVYQGLFPIIFKGLSQNKHFLYRGETILTINNLVYRLRSNYRFYTMVSITIAVTICVLGGAFTMKAVYNEQQSQAFVYPVAAITEEEVEVPDEWLKHEVKLLGLEGIGNGFMSSNQVLLMKQSDFVQLVTENGYKNQLSSLPHKLADHQIIQIERPGTLMSIATPVSEYEIENQVYEVVVNSRVVTLGGGINCQIQVVSDATYESLSPSATPLYFYGMRAETEEEANQRAMALSTLVGTQEASIFNGYSYLASVSWVKLVYAIGAFLFFVVMMATGSIIYMKLYHDGSEDKEKYQVLLKIGVRPSELGQAIVREVVLFYLIPLGVGVLHSYFAISALGDLMTADLTPTFFIAVIVCLVIFTLLCICSIQTFKRLIGIKQSSL